MATVTPIVERKITAKLNQREILLSNLRFTERLPPVTTAKI